MGYSVQVPMAVSECEGESRMVSLGWGGQWRAGPRAGRSTRSRTRTRKYRRPFRGARGGCSSRKERVRVVMSLVKTWEEGGSGLRGVG